MCVSARVFVCVCLHTHVFAHMCIWVGGWAWVCASLSPQLSVTTIFTPFMPTSPPSHFSFPCPAFLHPSVTNITNRPTETHATQINAHACTRVHTDSHTNAHIPATQERFELLETFAHMYGHACPPQKHLPLKFRNLGYWVTNIRVRRFSNTYMYTCLVGPTCMQTHVTFATLS